MSGRSFRLRHHQAVSGINAPADDVYAALVLESPGVYTYAVGGNAALELVELTAGTFSPVAVGTSPDSPRLRATARGRNTYVAR